MCFAIFLDHVEWFHPDRPHAEKSMSYEYNQHTEQTAQPSTSIRNESLKRLSSADLNDVPCSKRAKTSKSTADLAQVIVTEDENFVRSSPLLQSKADNSAFSDTKKDVATEDTVRDGEGDGNEQKFQDLRTRFNKRLSEKVKRIKDLEVQLEEKDTLLRDMEKDRDEWQDKAIVSETAEKLFRDSTKKVQDDVRKKIISVVKEEHTKRIEEMRESHEGLLEFKDENFRKRTEAKDRKHTRQLRTKDDRISELEATLHETRTSAKQSEKELKLLHREELKKYRPEHSIAVKDQKSELKVKEAALERMTKERDDLHRERIFYQSDWTVAQERNEKLQSMVRNNSKKVIELQEEVTKWKDNATGFQQAQDATRKDIEALIQSNVWKSQKVIDAGFVREQELCIQLAAARRGIALLNRANDRNLMRIRHLETTLAAAESKLEGPQKETQALNTEGREVQDDHKIQKPADAGWEIYPSHEGTGHKEAVELDKVDN